MKLIFFFVLATYVEANIIKHNLIEYLLGSNSTYRKDEEPPGILTEVQIQVEIYEIAKTEAHNTEFIFDVYLRMWWSDKRLSYSHLANYSKLELAEEKTTLIWQPDVYFMTDRKPELHERKSSNRMVYIYQDGDIVYSERTSLTLRSSFDLTYYPYDEQVCRLELQSFTYTNDSLILNWKKDNPIEISGAQMTEFHISIGEYSHVDTPPLDQVGDYSTLKGIIILERTGHAHFFQLYGPSLAVVLVSWLALFIDEKKISPRLTVHTGCIIALITQWIGIYFIIPAVSYTRAIDVWMITHQFIIVIAFLANILSLMARREDLPNKASTDEEKEKNLLKRLNEISDKMKTRFLCERYCCNCFNRFCCSCEAELESNKPSDISNNNSQAKLIEIVAIIALLGHYIVFLCVYITCVPTHKISVNLLLLDGTAGLVICIVLVTIFFCCIGMCILGKGQNEHDAEEGITKEKRKKSDTDRVIHSLEVKTDRSKTKKDGAKDSREAKKEKLETEIDEMKDSFEVKKEKSETEKDRVKDSPGVKRKKSEKEKDGVKDCSKVKRVKSETEKDKMKNSAEVKKEKFEIEKERVKDSPGVKRKKSKKEKDGAKDCPKVKHEKSENKKDEMKHSPGVKRWKSETEKYRVKDIHEEKKEKSDIEKDGVEDSTEIKGEKSETEKDWIKDTLEVKMKMSEKDNDGVMKSIEMKRENSGEVGESHF